MPITRPATRKTLDLPSVYRLVPLREVGDAFAHAQAIAAEEGAGTLVDPFTWQAHPGTVGKPVPADQVVVGDDEGHPLPVTASGEAGRLRLGLALAAIGTAGLDRSRIRCCEGEGCVLVYYDSSRNGSRRWCDMAACGNRAKSAAHYQRIRRTTSS
jgi:hypothetical protein